MLFKFLILSALFNILCASPPGSRGSASDKNNQRSWNSRDDKKAQPSSSSSYYPSNYYSGSEPQRSPLDLSTRNRQTDQSAASTSGAKKELFDCPQCDKSYTTIGNLHRHMNYKHKGKNEFCKECGKSYNNNSGMAYHMQIHHQGRTYDCTKCNEKFSSKTNLANHDAFVHQDNSEPLKCDKCPYQTKHKSTFISHIRTHRSR